MTGAGMDQDKLADMEHRVMELERIIQEQLVANLQTITTLQHLCVGYRDAMARLADTAYELEAWRNGFRGW